MTRMDPRHGSKMFSRHEASREVPMSSRYWCASPLDSRYYGASPDMIRDLHPYISEEASIEYQLRVESNLATMLARWGICSRDIADEIEHACKKVTVEEVYEEEKQTQHNVRALVKCIQRRLDESAAGYVHLFATSADILDTGNALRIRDAMRNVIIPDLLRLQGLLISLARKHAGTVQIGRTHGKHAEPITFGFALANYVARLGGRIQELSRTTDELRGKFSGAVGAYNALSLFYPRDPAMLEIEFLKELGLRASDTNISTQIVAPEFITDLAYAIISCYSVLANLADDIRHLHRTEIGEVQEEYEVHHIGSSTMPHKVNPKDFENVKSMWKAYMPRMTTVLMDQISEHQRDLTNSASGRYLLELIVAFDYSVRRLTSAIHGIYADADRMLKNLEMSKNTIVAEPLYILLAMNGYPDAYEFVRKLVAESVKTQRPLLDLAEQHANVASVIRKLKPEQRAILEDPSNYAGASYQRTLATCDKYEFDIESMDTRYGISPDTKSKIVQELRRIT